MKTIVRLDVSDEQRNALARLLTGKPVKRLATREEVSSYVQGAIDALGPPADPQPLSVMWCAPEVNPISPSDQAAARRKFEQRLAEGDEREENWPSYLRGWVSAA